MELIFGLFRLLREESFFEFLFWVLLIYLDSIVGGVIFWKGGFLGEDFFVFFFKRLFFLMEFMEYVTFFGNRCRGSINGVFLLVMVFFGFLKNLVYI